MNGMKMLMLIARSERREELEVFLRMEGLHGYTEISDVHGLGSTGPRMGSSVSPATSTMILTMLEAERLAAVVTKLRAFCAECQEHLQIAHWDVTVESIGARA